MNELHTKEDTPLKFHKLFRFVILPLGVLNCVFRIILIVRSNLQPNIYTYVDLLFFIVILMTSLICFIGFFSWASYAWYCVMLQLVLKFIFQIYAITAYMVLLPDQILGTMPNRFGSLIHVILVGIYYIKRRSLFFHIPNSEQVITLLQGQTSYLSSSPKTLISAKKAPVVVVIAGDFGINSVLNRHSVHFDAMITAVVRMAISKILRTGVGYCGGCKEGLVTIC